MSQLNSSATPFIGSANMRMGSGVGASLQTGGNIQHSQQQAVLSGMSHSHHSGTSSPTPQGSSTAASGAGVRPGSPSGWSPQMFMNFSTSSAPAAANSNRLGSGFSVVDPSMLSQLNSGYNAQGGAGAAGANSLQSFLSHSNPHQEEQRSLQAQQQLQQLQAIQLQMQQSGGYTYAQPQAQVQYHPRQQQLAFAPAQMVNSSAAAAAGAQPSFGSASPYANISAAQHAMGFSAVPTPPPISAPSLLSVGPMNGMAQPPLLSTSLPNSSLGSNVATPSNASGAALRSLAGDESRRNSSVTAPPAAPVFSTPNISQSSIIRDVWDSNLEEEFEVIRSLIADYPYVAMDTEFPGMVAKRVGKAVTASLFLYETIRVNVNNSKLIQVGITLYNERGEVPEKYCTWQFNFSFSRATDLYMPDSIQLLEEGGINFDYLNTFGIDIHHFASLLLSSGLVGNPDVCWLAFHAGYDFGYLTKILYNLELPERTEEFSERFHVLFPRMFDLKHLLRQTPYSHSLGLDALAALLKMRRFGSAHQAGSDSLLTGHCYFRLLHDIFKGVEQRNGNGIIYGLTEDEASAEAGNASSSALNASHLSLSNSVGGSSSNQYNNNVRKSNDHALRASRNRT